MRGPRWRSDEIAVDDRFGHGQVDVRAAGLGDIRANGGIRAALLALQDASGGQDFRGVTDSCDGLISLSEMVNQFDDAWNKTDVFRRAPPWNDQSGVIFPPYFVKRPVLSENFAALFPG